jgi:integrase
VASIYKPTLRDPETGKRQKCQHWRIAFKDENGKRRTVRGYKDKAATEALARDIERRVERIKAGLPVERKERTQQPLEDAINAFLDDLARRGCGPQKFHHYECKRLLTKIREACNWKSLATIRADDFSKFLANLSKLGKSPRTLNRHHETLRNFLNWTIQQGWLEASPIARLQMTPVGQAGRRRRRRAYTIEEWHRLLDNAGSRRAIYLIASLSGLRRSELLRLEKRDVQPMRWTLRAEITKNGRAENIPMLEECWEELKPIWEAARGPTDKLFPSLPAMATLHDDLERARIPRKDPEGRWVDFHSLRYFFCTLLAKKLPIQMVRLLMRHRDITMTCNLYMDLGLTDLNQAILALPRVLEPSTTNITASADASQNEPALQQALNESTALRKSDFS